MRRDKIVARILLIFSIANAVLAAPAVVRQGRFVDRAGDESTDESTPSLGSGSGYSPSYEASPAPDTAPLLTGDSDPTSSFHLPSDFDTDQYYSDQLSSSHFNSMDDSSDGVSSGTSHLPASSDTSYSPASVAPQLDDDPSSASGSQQLSDFDSDQYYLDPLSSSHFNSMTESSDGLSSATSHSAASVTSQLEDDPPSVSGSQQLKDVDADQYHLDQPQLDGDPPSASGSQQLNDLPHTSGSPPPQDHPEAAQLHNPLPGPGDRPLYDDLLPSWHDFPIKKVEREEEDKVKSKESCGLFS